MTIAPAPTTVPVRPDVLAALIAGRALITPRRRWARGVSARTMIGNPVRAESPMAYCWCSTGALLKITAQHEHTKAIRTPLYRGAYFRLADALPAGFDFVPDANDRLTHRQVLDVWDRAIDAERAGDPDRPGKRP